jgi:hypothetical protein
MQTCVGLSLGVSVCFRVCGKEAEGKRACEVVLGLL